MSNSVRCKCGEVLNVSEEQADGRVACPACGAMVDLARSRRRRFEDDDEPAPGQTRTSGKAISALIFGVLSFCVPVLMGIPAVILAVLSLGEIGNSHGRLTGRGFAITGMVLGIVGSLMGLVAGVLALPMLLLFPAVEKVRVAAERAQNMNNMKQIALALHNYNDDFKRLPPAVIRDAQGKPLYSWRVAILPYLEERALYEKFKKDEPWDSPANKPLLDRMPRVFTSVGDPPGGNGTRYKVFVAPPNVRPRTMFSDPRGVSLPTIPDGTSNTLMVVELGDPVPWSSPEDIPFRPGDPQPIPMPFRGPKPGYVLGALGDGSVLTMREDLDPTELKRLIGADDGELLDMDKIRK